MSSRSCSQSSSVSRRDSSWLKISTTPIVMLAVSILLGMLFLSTTGSPIQSEQHHAAPAKVEIELDANMGAQDEFSSLLQTGVTEYARVTLGYVDEFASWAFASFPNMLVGSFGVLLASSLLSTVLSELFGHRKSFAGKHVLVTGGSTGIGRCIAKRCLELGAHVTLLARTKANLEAAVESLKREHDADVYPPIAGGNLQYVCADVTDPEAMKAAATKAVENFSGQPVDILFACAGASDPGYFLEQRSDTFRKTMELNYMGCVHAAQAVAPSMCDRGEGSITFIASTAAIISFIGYTSYAPSKFAVRGLADGLRNELCGFGVDVSIAYPPDTKTPGFENEEKGKPKECKEVSSDPPTDPQVVANGIIDGVTKGQYHIRGPDFIQNMLVTTMCGVSPRVQPVFELLTAPLWGLAEQLFLFHADSCAKGYGRRIRSAKQ